MKKELIINSSVDGVEIALLEDKKLVELHFEHALTEFNVGDIYVGKIKKLMPSLNAAFVDVGFEKDAFLHYTDLSPYFRSLIKFTKESQSGQPSWGNDFGKFVNEKDILKTGKIVDVIEGKPEVVVQILKEPISTKGPRLSCEISLPGRFLVLTPFNDVVAISRKIHSAEERKRLQNIVESIKPKNFGIIVRTAAEGKNTVDLHSDILSLVDKWSTIQENLAQTKAPKRVLGEQGKTTSIIRDLLNESFESIIVNDKGILAETKSYVNQIAPDKLDIISYQNGGVSLFDTYGVSRQVKSSFGKTVNLNSGAYLIIEHTEALHVIDVNSGTRNNDGGQELSALATNLEAAEEICRQLRLRDLGGIVIVDFIDMKLPEHKKSVFEKMESLMASDRAKHTILPLSKFGLMQITRQRLKPEISISTSEVCPSCKGTGKIGPSILITDEIEKDFQYLLKQGHRNLLLQANPLVVGYLKKGFLWNTLLSKWRKKYQSKLQVKEDLNLGITEYHFVDLKSNEIIKMD